VQRIAWACILIAFAISAPDRVLAQPAGTITTFAGGGTLSGPAANGRPATEIQLSNQLSVAVDKAGNLYIADGGAAIPRVWKVTPAGIINAFAGGGTVGLGDGGPATNAAITASGVAADDAGNVYIAGGVLRKVNPAGIISTVANVNSTNVAVDGNGNVYVADILANRIRKIDPTGAVTNFAGSGASGFSGDGGQAINAALSLPQGVAADREGNVYFCDGGNARVRKVDPSGVIRTVAGNGTPISVGDGGPAVNAGMVPTFVTVDNEGNLYIADTGTSRIRKVNTAGTISTVAGGALPINPNLGDGGPATSAWLSGPRSVAVDSLGNIYIGDSNNRRIRKVSSGAVGSPIQADRESLAFSYTIGGPIPESQRVVIITPGATLTFTATTSASWLSVTPSSGSANNSLTVTVNPAGLGPGTYDENITLTPSGAGNAPRVIPVRLIVNPAASQSIITTVAGNGFLPLPGEFPGEGGPALNAPFSPYALATDQSGNLYITFAGLGSRILKLDGAGVIATFAGTGAIAFAGDGGAATRASFSDPAGLKVDSAGNVYIADRGNHRVRRVNTAGVINTVAGTGVLDIGPDNVPATASAVSSPSDIALDSSGNLYIAETALRVRRVNSAGIISTFAGGIPGGFGGDGGPATNARFASISGVVADSQGSVYIADTGNNRIRKVSNGIITTIAGNGTLGYSGDGGPAVNAALSIRSATVGMAVDAGGNLYFPDTGNHRIRKVDTSGLITTIAGNGVAGFTGDGGPAVNAGLNGPTAVAIDRAGDMYIADAGNNRVRKISGLGAGGAPGVCQPSLVNGASFQPRIAPNSWATVQGCVLSSSIETWDNFIENGRLPTTLAGVSVTIGGKPAYIYYVSPSQINLIVPDVEPGQARVVVRTSSGRSEEFTVTVSSHAPAFFPWPGGQVVATRQDFSYAARAGTFPALPTTQARPGEVLILWGTGFGPTTPPAPFGVQIPGDRTYSTSPPPSLTINNVPARVFGAALTPGFAALYQIAIEVPGTLGDGDFEVRASIGGAQSPAGAVLSVRR
jgi:uncharacterized protein (TIGR03437 family)